MFAYVKAKDGAEHYYHSIDWAVTQANKLCNNNRVRHILENEFSISAPLSQFLKSFILLSALASLLISVDYIKKEGQITTLQVFPNNYVQSEDFGESKYFFLSIESNQKLRIKFTFANDLLEDDDSSEDEDFPESSGLKTPCHSLSEWEGKVIRVGPTFQV